MQPADFSDFSTSILIWLQESGYDVFWGFVAKKSWKQRLSKLPKPLFLRNGPNRMMGGAELRNLEGLGYQAQRPVGDLIFIYVFDLQVIFKCSSQFSEPKWKTCCSQAEMIFQELFNVKKLLVDWVSFSSFWYWKALTIKTPPCKIYHLWIFAFADSEDRVSQKTADFVVRYNETYRWVG